jgi:hypothetical protein
MTGSGGTLRTQPPFAMRLSVDGFLMAERSDGYARRIANVPGGSFEGTRMSGIVLPVGNGWQALRTDGAVLLDARTVLQTTDGAFIATTYTGVRHAPGRLGATRPRRTLRPHKPLFPDRPALPDI